MRNKMIVLLAVILPVSAPLFAHHGNAAYATGTKATIKGTVTEWVWANPHSLLKMDSKDEKGEVQHWIIEGGNPADLSRTGWGKYSFKPGDEVEATVMLPKNGVPGIGRFSGPVTVNGQPLGNSATAAPANANSEQPAATKP